MYHVTQRVSVSISRWISRNFPCLSISFCWQCVRMLFAASSNSLSSMSSTSGTSHPHQSHITRAASHHPQFGVAVSAPDGVMNVFHTRTRISPAHLERAAQTFSNRARPRSMYLLNHRCRCVINCRHRCAVFHHGHRSNVRHNWWDVVVRCTPRWARELFRILRVLT